MGKYSNIILQKGSSSEPSLHTIEAKSPLELLGTDLSPNMDGKWPAVYNSAMGISLLCHTLGSAAASDGSHLPWPCPVLAPGAGVGKLQGARQIVKNSIPRTWTPAPTSAFCSCMFSEWGFFLACCFPKWPAFASSLFSGDVFPECPFPTRPWEHRKGAAVLAFPLLLHGEAWVHKLLSHP